MRKSNRIWQIGGRRNGNLAAGKKCGSRQSAVHGCDKGLLCAEVVVYGKSADAATAILPPTRNTTVGKGRFAVAEKACLCAKVIVYAGAADAATAIFRR